MVDPIPPPGQQPSNAPTPPPIPSVKPGPTADPTGVWQHFLSVGGTQATPDEVKMFLNGLLKMFNVLIQQDAKAHKRSMQRLKEAQDE